MTGWIAWAAANSLWLVPLGALALAPPLVFRLLRKRQGSTDFGSDRWATKTDIKRAGLFR